MSDLISRQDTIYALLEKGQQSRRYKFGEIWELNFDEIREALAMVPPALPEEKWIPVSKRLPKVAGVYTVTDSKGDVVRFVFNNTETSREYWKRCAKAWMPLPLPKPYQGEE